MVTMFVVCVTGRMPSLVQSTSRRDCRLSRPQSSTTSVSRRHFIEEREEGRERGREGGMKRGRGGGREGGRERGRGERGREGERQESLNHVQSTQNYVNERAMVPESCDWGG